MKFMTKCLGNLPILMLSLLIFLGSCLEVRTYFFDQVEVVSEEIKELESEQARTRRFFTPVLLGIGIKNFSLSDLGLQVSKGPVFFNEGPRPLLLSSLLISMPPPHSV